LKALEANDRKAAQTAMRNHIDHVRTRLIDFLEHGSLLKPVAKHT
jgi:DNA-binding GntR family transcriptional regulator